MSIQTNCPMCGKVMFLEMDPDYAKLGDPYTLENLAKRVHCKHCAKFLNSRSRLKERIAYYCFLLRGLQDEQIRDARLKMLRDLLEVLLRVFNGFYRPPPDEPVPFDEMILDILRENPEKYAEVLNRMEQSVKGAPKQNNLTFGNPSP